MKRLLILLVIFAISRISKPTNYEVIGDSTKFFEICTGKDAWGNINMTDIIDMSQLEYTHADDFETVYVNGLATVNVQIPEAKIEMHMELYKWKRGQWVETIFSIKRRDFCKAAFSPFELWEVLMRSIPEKLRICPPKLGTIYSMENITNRVVLANMPTSSLAGKYKGILHFKVANLTSCMDAIFNIYKT